MLLERERELVVRFARRLRPDGLAIVTAGNLSLRSRGLTAITPTSVDYDELEAEAIAVVNEIGVPVDGAHRPSSELPMHLAAYGATGAGAVVHTHSPYATALATAGIALPPVHYLAADLGGWVRIAPYATFGSDELAESVATTLAGRTAVLLERHGTLTVGDTLEQAYERALVLEWLATVYVRASALGSPVALDDTELERVSERFEDLRNERRSIGPLAC
ncbi:MAG TPA: class II aldolase/adducin family protein [Gaiellaceae bacterium]|nr:class II aldolase/adducin family protein [Gaiellaceae bacterium]